MPARAYVRACVWATGRARCACMVVQAAAGTRAHGQAGPPCCGGSPGLAHVLFISPTCSLSAAHAGVSLMRLPFFDMADPCTRGKRCERCVGSAPAAPAPLGFASTPHRSTPLKVHTRWSTPHTQAAGVLR